MKEDDDPLQPLDRSAVAIWPSLAAAAVAAALAGCMPTGLSPEAIASAKQEVAGCYRTAKTMVAAAECQNAVVARLADGDLADVMATSRIVIAEKFDRGLITRAEASPEMAKVVADVNTEGQQRSAAIAASMPLSCTTAGATTTCY
jgi:hypothetical protein